MSSAGHRHTRRILHLSGGTVDRHSNERHTCRVCGAGWNPLELGDLCPMPECQPSQEPA